MAAKAKAKLDWCIARLGNDHNWWVTEISDNIHWDLDGLGIIDPRQLNYILDLLEGLQEYGVEPDLVDNAFYTFSIDREEKDKHLRLVRANTAVTEIDQPYFALPDVVDEEKGPYADFLDHITKLRVKMLNDLIDFKQKFTVDELEEEIREQQNNDFMEGRAMHYFHEIVAILEFVPQGYTLETDEEEDSGGDEEDIAGEFEDIGDEDEKIEEDETMRWDEDEEEEDEEESSPADDGEDEEDDDRS